MKRRPRRIEQEVAEWLSEYSLSRGFRPVKRIPILGRSGPDIEINELGLVVDVKSRKECPLGAFPQKGEVLALGDLLAVRLDDLARLYSPTLSPTAIRGPFKIVNEYWAHMDLWRQAEHPSGVTAIILHRPGKPVRCCSVVIHSLERSKLYAS